MATSTAERPSSSTRRSRSAGSADSADPDTSLRSLLAALTALRDGEFSVRLPVGEGLAGQVADRFNEVAALHNRRTRELVRVSQVIGREGRMTARLDEIDAIGEWASGAQAVNSLIDDLVRPTTEVSRVIAAVAKGDLSQHMALEIAGQPVKGEYLRIGQTVNTMVDQLSSFADEVTRVAREVGTEGKLGGQAQVRGVSGVWRDLTENVNGMAGNLTSQVRNIAQVTTAVAQGDLSQKITVDARGEILELKNTVNTMVDQLSAFAAEVTRVAREVGTEGRLGGQAQVKGVSGTWRDLTDSVNQMAGNLTSQVRNIAQVATAVARGDLTQQITVDAYGEIAALADTVNTMVDQLSSFAAEVTRVAREVGTEGKLGGQADVPGVGGTWKALTDSVNSMAGNLTSQVRNIAQVATAVAQGDLSQKITVDAKGEVAALADTINSLTDTLRVFAEQVTTVAREVGTEGKLGGQADVPGVAGTWKDLTDSVNSMARNLTAQVRDIAAVTTAVAKGDLSQKVAVDVKGETLELKSTINTMVDQLSSFADEVTRVAREVGTEGKLGGQAQVRGVSGVWRDLTENVNFLAGNLTSQVRNIAQVTTAVARGDLSQKITVDARGEILELKNTVNTMVDQLSSFADEVTRVAREVGTEGKLGGQAQVKGVSGTWRDLTDNVNFMASNLTDQVRNIAQVTTAVAQGDLSQKITVDARGEILELKDTVNTMVDQLSSFADEVTRVAGEVGSEGKLGGQAQVRGVSGTWKDLTQNVNRLASTLTTQLRAIADVSTAVTRGDLTRSIAVAAQGEVAELKDNINQMIANLKETTEKSAQQDWLKSNLARIGGKMQGQRDLGAVCQMIMSEVTPVVEAQLGAFFLRDGAAPAATLRLISSYGWTGDSTASVRTGEGLIGQAVVEKRSIRVRQVPADYLRVSSGLGSAPPADLVVLPVLFEEQPLGVIELASFQELSELHLDFLEQLVETIGVVLNTIIANARTEELLEQSQRLTRELQVQSEELQRTNAELEDKAALLGEQNRNIEIKNREIEMARLGLEEKAEQLALASQYKSEFLANMSHELRTPLNSLLILAQLLSDNPERNLTPKQIEFARTIHRAGSDLLELINDILDLSKVEAGKMDVRPTVIELSAIRDYVEQSFRPQAEQKGLELVVETAPGLPRAVVTDEQRLRQVLKNLLSNAMKFTDTGRVTLAMGPPPPDMTFTLPTLAQAEQVVAFAVRDTGIGVPPDKLKSIFEAFQQADGTTSRKYGGTGLGLSISREIARLLGGSISADSQVGAGSTFTLFVPLLHPFADAELLSADPVAATAVPAPPLLRPQPAAAPESVPDPGPTALTGATVLVVDDDVRNVFALTSALELHGMTVLYADNGRDGVRLLQQHREVDLVLMDVMMPGMDGNETTAAIRRLPQFRDLPILFLTAKAMPGDRDKSVAAGASDYITKPVDLDRLLDVMRSWLARTGTGKTAG
jgi:HAMP domain-containing protein/signal transduction histidine kinase/ActR/RegA family two-component response regulator